MNKYSHDKIFWSLFQTLLFLLLFSLLISSCRTVRYIDRVRVEKDSAAVHEVDSLVNIHKADSITIEYLSQQKSDNQIIFQDTGSTKIVYRPDGSIESVQGKLKSANFSLSKREQELFSLKHNYDSLFSVKRKDSIVTNTVTVEKIVDKKVSFIPVWFWLIVAIALVVGYYIKKYVK